MRIAELTGALLVVGFAMSPQTLSAGPDRLVALGGSVTETVYALGAGELLVGADDTSFYPAAAAALPKVGYYRQVSAEGVLALKPTRVLADQNAGPPVALEQLRAAGVEVVTIGGAEDAAGLKGRVMAVGAAIGKKAEASALVEGMDGDLAKLAALRKGAAPVRAVFVMARGVGALSVAGRDTVGQAMLELAGGTNAAAATTGYRPLTAESLVSAAPEVIVMTTRGLQSAGGVEGMLKAPGIALTPAGKKKKVVALDDLYLLGFGPRTPQAAIELFHALRGTQP